MATAISIEGEDLLRQAGMVLVPEGHFWMGSDQGSKAERPVHRVWVDTFFMDATPVTNKQFAAFVATTGYQTMAERLEARMQADETLHPGPAVTWRTFATPDRADHPVVMVSWHDANTFAHWTGRRLPTEAEWERAARSGLEHKLYPWGDEAPDGARVCWMRAQLGGTMPGTLPVRSFPQNAYGIYDMAGNVWEWCNDWYRDPYYYTSPESNPEGPESGQFRSRRGGAWNVREAFRLRCSNRGAMLPDGFWPNLGFRCVRRGRE